MSTEKPRRLGRGLEALIAAKTAAATEPQDQSALRQLPITQIRPNPYQPRKEFRPEELAELEASLRTSGLLQPITVRPAPSGTGYELIAGERRLRAATRLGWTEIPAIVKEIDDRTLLTLALIENLQRADLNPIEEAQGYQRLITDFSLTQQEVADLVGKDRTTVTNILRLLQLPTSVRRLVQDGQLTLGHARALLAIGNEHQMLDLAREIVAKGLTVRDVERRARDHASLTTRQKRQRDSSPPLHIRRVTDELRRYLQTDVSISASDNHRGKIEITFYSEEDLDRLVELILGAKREQL